MFDFGLSTYFKGLAEKKQQKIAEAQQEAERQKQREANNNTQQGIEVRLDRIFDELKDAVKSADVQQIRLLGEEIRKNREEQKAFSEKTGRRVSDEIQRFDNRGYYSHSTVYAELKELIGTAVYQDNVAVFKELRAILPFSLNEKGQWLLSTPKVHGFERFHNLMPLIHLAIHERKANIAAALAQDPAVDVHATWDAHRQCAWFGQEGYRAVVADKDITPLVLARERGLTEVVAVLARRELEILRKASAQLEQESAAVPVPPPAAPAP